MTQLHPELLQIAKTAELDHELAGLAASIKKQHHMHATAKNAVETKQNELDGVEAKIAHSRKQELTLQTDIEKLQRRRKSAHRVLDGTAEGGDPEAAQRQLEQCDDLLDDRETQVLENLEQRDSFEQERTQVQAQLQERQQLLTDLEVSVPVEDTRLKAIYNKQHSEREQSFKLLPKELQKRYTSVRRRRGSAVAEILKGSCSACHFSVAQQHRSDLLRGLIIPCKSCGRWLLIEAE
jgi:predicted  nucleic acid-binding Zn-ribbon protein